MKIKKNKQNKTHSVGTYLLNNSIPPIWRPWTLLLIHVGHDLFLTHVR